MHEALLHVAHDRAFVRCCMPWSFAPMSSSSNCIRDFPRQLVCLLLHDTVLHVAMMILHVAYHTILLQLIALVIWKLSIAKAP